MCLRILHSEVQYVSIVSESSYHVSLCLQSNDVVGERVIDVSSCVLRCVECITVIARQGETLLQTQREIGLQRRLRNGSTDCRKQDSRLQ
jgi:hypothetical protein